MADRLTDSDLGAMREAGCVAAGCKDPAWSDRRLHAPNCTQPDIDVLLAEVRRLRAELRSHRMVFDSSVDPDISADKTLWRPVDGEDSDG
jgi:hypothetical protein